MSLFVFSFYTIIIANSVYCSADTLSSLNDKDNTINDLFVRVKRTDVDLQTCIDNFDVHKDKIIRTQDSRDMGAKYLNEIDLGSREECLRLCCETDTCDVFVFEEKSPGSCYLFHCGPPEDFKCKFTRHVNYTSAVLALSRHNELENQIKMTKHEQDLTRLRKPEDLPALKMNPSLTGPNQVHTTSRPVQQLTSAPHASALTSKEILPANIPKHTGRSCSRYQFECRSTSECIAIYNACDGIPQCTDGSDEAPELGCPASTASVTAVPPSPHQPLRSSSQQRSDSTNHENHADTEEPDAPASVVVAPQSSGRGTVLHAHESASTDVKVRPAAFQSYDQSNIPNHYQHPLSAKTADIIPPKVLPSTSRNMHSLSGVNSGIEPVVQISRENRPLYDRTGPSGSTEDGGPVQIPPPRALPVSSFSVGQLTPLSRTDVGLGSAYQAALPSNPGQQSWIPHQSNQMPPIYNPTLLQQNQMQYTDQNSHIFNHKLTGIQVADPLESIPNTQYGDGGIRDFPKLPNYYNSDAYRPQMPIPDSWPTYARGQDNVNSPYLAPDIRENWQAMQMHMMNRQGPVVDPDIPPNWKLSPHIEKLDSKPDNVESDKRNNMPLEDDENKKKGKTAASIDKKGNEIKTKHVEIKNKTVHHNNSHKHHNTPPMNAELKMSEEITIVDIKDGEADKPNGAILSLTLGLCLTSIMVVIIGCRLRVVRKRMRRGGKSPYAHDADYLVNGMYL